MKRFAIIVCLMMQHTLAFAERAMVKGAVTEIEVHLNDWSSSSLNQVGHVFISMAGLPDTCNKRRVMVSTEHPLFEQIYHLAVMAKVHRLPLKVVYHSECSKPMQAFRILITSL